MGSQESHDSTVPEHAGERGAPKPDCPELNWDDLFADGSDSEWAVHEKMIGRKRITVLSLGARNRIRKALHEKRRR